MRHAFIGVFALVGLAGLLGVGPAAGQNSDSDSDSDQNGIHNDAPDSALVAEDFAEIRDDRFEFPRSAEIDSILSDRAKLVVFYITTGGDGWDIDTNWLSNEPLGNWYGVETNAKGRVTGLSLPDNNVSGAIDHNGLTEEIAAQLGQLTGLQQLDLARDPAAGRRGSASGLADHTGIVGPQRQPVEGVDSAGVREPA